MSVIKVENLSKKYLINHNSPGVPPGDFKYRTLRDTLTSTARELLQRLCSLNKPSKPEDFWALKDITFNVQPGDRIGIIGRNGAGKSTLLKILSRITEPTTGRIEIDGRVASLLEVGTGFHPELTGRENIYLNGAVLGMSRSEIKNRFNDIVSFAEIETFLDTPVKRYSSGMFVRLAFSVAAHLEPEILLVDEVLAVGDISFQKKCLGRMKDISESGRTILFVSHNLEAIRTLCTRAILLDDGKIINDSSPERCIHEYTSHSLDALQNLNIDHFRREAITPKTPAWIKKIFQNNELITASGLPGYNSGEAISFSFDLVVASSIPSIALSIVLYNEAGECVSVINSADKGTTLSLLPPHTRVECTLMDNPLREGRYTATIGINEFSNQSKAYDVLINYPIFEIVTVPGANGQWPTRPKAAIHWNKVAWNSGQSSDQ